MPNPYILQNVPGKISFSWNTILRQTCQLPCCVIPFCAHNLVQFQLITIIFSSKLLQETCVGCYRLLLFPQSDLHLKDDACLYTQ